MNDSFAQGVTSSPYHAQDNAVQPSVSRGPRVWAGAILLLAGLGLIVVGGCFLIGALGLAVPQFVHPAIQDHGDSGSVLVLFILCLAFAVTCLAGAAFLFVVAVRGLLRIMNEEGPASIR
jgi:hypothetical protein